jgi:hypothetical protein
MNQMALSCGPSSVDPAELVVRMREDVEPESCALDRDDDVGIRMDAGSRRHLAVRDDVIAAGAGFHTDLPDEVLFPEALAESGVTPRGEFHRERDAKEQRRKRPRADSFH